MAARLSELGRFSGRIRVIAGAAPEGFRVPTDVAGRLRALDLPSRFVALAGGVADSDGLSSGFHGVVGAGWGGDVVVLDCPEGQAPAVEIGRASGRDRGCQDVS